MVGTIIELSVEVYGWDAGRSDLYHYGIIISSGWWFQWENAL